jgi:hypothetical protein
VTFDIATDGSFNKLSGIASYGWVVTLNKTIIAKAQGPTPAHKDMSEPFRAEVYGVASVTSFINLLMEHMNDKADRHKWFCLVDNTLLIRKLEKYATETITPKWHLLPDADILEYTAKQLITIPMNFIHVKSHQDRKPGKINFDAQLNCMADELAQRQNSVMKEPMEQNYPQFCHLSLNEVIVTRDSQRWLREAAGAIPVQKYYHDKFRWSKRTFESINWSAQQAVLQRYDCNDRRRILKFVHGWLPTYDRLFREKQTPIQ